MAGLALAGWTFTYRDWAQASWEGRRLADGYALHAPTLFSLLGYIERVMDQNYLAPRHGGKK